MNNEKSQPREQANLPSTLWRIRFPDGSVATLEGEPADYMKPYATAYHIPRQVAPEAPTCTGCDPAEGFCRACRDAEQRSIAATTASASGEDFYLASDGVEHSHPAYGQGVFFTHDCCRATAPSPDAAPLDTETLWEIHGVVKNAGSTRLAHKIADAIAQQGAAQAPTESFDELKRKIAERIGEGNSITIHGRAAQAAHAGAVAEKPETVDIEREGAKFWHMNCTNHFGGVMREKVREADKSLIECLSCGKCGYYPVGRAGLVRAAMSAATEQKEKS